MLAAHKRASFIEIIQKKKKNPALLLQLAATAENLWKFTVCNYKTTIVVSVRFLFSSQQAHPLNQTCRQEITGQNTDSAHFLQRGCDSNESSATVFVINNCSLFQMFVCCVL